jgi:hypothetical protein
MELRALKERQPDLAEAINMHLELLDVQRRVQGRMPIPNIEISADIVNRHQADARPLLRFEDIPLELSDLRLVVRQTADIMRRFDALDEDDYQQVQHLGRDMTLIEVIGRWYRAGADKHATPVGTGGVTGAGARVGTDVGTNTVPPDPTEIGMLDQVLALAMRPFLSRCAEVLQQRAELAIWTHSHCALCGGEPDLSVITPAAERHLICARCGLRWKFEPLTCPYCRNSDRSRITSFATPDGQYRVYACDVCNRYLKAYDGRRAARPVMPVVDAVATLPLDAAAIQRGYSG